MHILSVFVGFMFRNILFKYQFLIFSLSFQIWSSFGDEDSPRGEGETHRRGGPQEAPPAGRLRGVRQPPKSGVPQGRQEGVRVHLDGRRRIGTRKIDTYQLNVSHRHLLRKVSGTIGEDKKDGQSKNF